MKETTKPTQQPFIPAVLLLTLHPDEREQEADRAAEMASLMDTAGRKVMATVVQHVAKPVPATYIGSGKVEELVQAVQDTGAAEVVVDVQLNPRQQRNLETGTKKHVLDYDELILAIFAANARTDQAKLAVELAQAEYDRVRLKRLWTHLDRQLAGGAAGKSSGFMTGTGEKQIEMDRRQVRKRIQVLRERLLEIAERRGRTVAARESFNVALVGYTNAGKSTLMNALTSAGVLAEDRLFATLDTRTARLPLAGHRNVVLSDTVGFIRKLPPGLIASFHATLAEVREADLLLHVVDAASPVMDQQIAAVEDVLKAIGADHLPAVMVFNKVDRCASRILVGSARKRYRTSVLASAATGEGLERLREEVAAAVGRARERLVLRYPVTDGALDAFVRARCAVTAERYEGDTAVLEVEADAPLAAELRGDRRLAVGSGNGMGKAGVKGASLRGTRRRESASDA